MQLLKVVQSKILIHHVKNINLYSDYPDLIFFYQIIIKLINFLRKNSSRNKSSVLSKKKKKKRKAGK